MPNIKTEIEKIKEEETLDKAFASFMINAHLFTPNDRTKLVALFHELLMPKYYAKMVAPINEDYLKAKELKEDRGDDSGRYETKGGDVDGK